HYLEEADQLANRLVVLAGGRVLADTTPAGLRGRSGMATVRLPLPPDFGVRGLAAADVPPSMRLVPGRDADHPDAIEAKTADVTATIAALLAWSRRQGVSLDGLEVGPPSLEDAYLSLIRTTPGTESTAHDETAGRVLQEVNHG
ncbi:MAG: hypothetical protein ACRDJU_08660, partial [Actinomycetota bacterium]